MSIPLVCDPYHKRIGGIGYGTEQLVIWLGPSSVEIQFESSRKKARHSKFLAVAIILQFPIRQFRWAVGLDGAKKT
jgi:hypothetical protein